MFLVLTYTLYGGCRLVQTCAQWWHCAVQRLAGDWKATGKELKAAYVCVYILPNCLMCQPNDIWLKWNAFSCTTVLMWRILFPIKESIIFLVNRCLDLLTLCVTVKWLSFIFIGLFVWGNGNINDNVLHAVLHSTRWSIGWRNYSSSCHRGWWHHAWCTTTNTTTSDFKACVHAAQDCLHLVCVEHSDNNKMIMEEMVFSAVWFIKC